MLRRWLSRVMKAYIANRFGVAGSTIAVTAVVASVSAMMLPYRISQFQAAILHTAFVVELAGPLLAIILGSAALGGDTRSRRFGFIAIALSVFAFVLVMLTPNAHSISHW